MKSLSRLYIIVSVFLFCKIDSVSAQKIILTDGKNFYQSNTSNGYCTYSELSLATCFLKPAGPYTLALYKDTLYYNNANGELCYSLLSNPSVCVWVDSGAFTNAMTVDKNGILYMVTVLNNLIEYDPHTKIWNTIGHLYFEPGGDLLFYGNQLIMSSSSGQIVQVNIANPDQSTVLFQDTSYVFYGLANVSTTCNPNDIIGYAIKPFSSATSIVQIDMVKQTLTPLCEIPFGVFDAGSVQEIGGDGTGDTSFSILDTMGCAGSSLLLDAGSPGSIYMWDNNITQETRSVNSPGKYWVTVNDAGCSYIDTFFCSFSSSPQIYFPKDTTVCEPIPIKLQPIFLQSDTISNTYVWQDGSSNPYFIANKSGLYILNASNTCGSTVDSILVNFVNCSCTFFVPNAFTPNNDGINDVFHPRYTCGNNGVVNNYSIRIFDRWGQLMFYSNQPDAFWDGKYKGHLQPSGTYVWELEYTDYSKGAPVHQNGVVLLIH